jgi:hypothetical protein
MESTTQDRSTQTYTNSIESETFMQNLKTYLLNPLSTGLAGFATFFTLILLTKTFSYILGTNDTFSLELSDVIYSLTGFVFAAGAKFVEFFGKED